MIPKKIGVVSRCDTVEAVQMVNAIVNSFQDSVKIVLEPRAAAEIGKRECASPLSKMDVDMIITVGGDGTILRTIQLLSKPTPILGINMGDVGFLADVHPTNAKEVIEQVLRGFEIQKRARLAVHVNDKKFPPATNEVAIITSRPAKILHFRVLIDGKEIETTRADGVVVATPTGSTAYAMSAGGPIIDPHVDAFVIVPLAPYKLSARPWVIPGDSEITLELLRIDKNATVVIDGQHRQTITKEDITRFTRAREPALFVRMDRDFYAKVRDTLVV
ncbi:MAG: NAD(+)/NADH kinase [Methanocellales archaeon]|nr:NAD(+)/NADH kinase [Methanocellales archaeon]